MTPIKPYLIRAVRDWAIDSGFTPLIVVDATIAGVKVPPDSVENGRILLNVHARAVQDFDMDSERLLFSARFAGRSCALEVPVVAVRAIYARENGQGVAFPEDSTGENSAAQPPSSGSDDPPPKKGPHLKVVK